MLRHAANGRDAQGLEIEKLSQNVNFTEPNKENSVLPV